MNVTDTKSASGVAKLFPGHAVRIARITSSLAAAQLGLSARVMFVLILLPYYFNSALTKIDGVGLSAGAFAQILPPIAEQYLYDTSAIPFFPWHLIVWGGTLAEFILPVLILIGFATRLSALGMIGFVIVQTIVDVAFHGAALGMLANGLPTELIDQRALWTFLLAILVVTGGGMLSVDHAILRRKHG